MFDVLEIFKPAIGLILVVGLVFVVVDALTHRLVKAIKRKKQKSYSSNRALSKGERAKVGEQFELAIGSWFEQDGWTVSYTGIERGVNDGGIDLIAKRDGMTFLIQCKYWRANRIIYEKHINQFHGAIETYRADHPDEPVQAAFYTTARLSPEAKRAAQIHEIEVNERYRF